jgi:hypothetical protein
MKPNKTAHTIFMIASAIITVGSFIAILLLRHDWTIALPILLCDVLILAAGAIPLIKPEWSVNYRPRRVDGHWKNEKTQVPPTLFMGLLIFITIVLANLSMFIN